MAGAVMNKIWDFFGIDNSEEAEEIEDKAYDYEGLWLFWWDPENKTDLYENYESMAANQGTIVLAGGAAVLETEAVNGTYAIAFSEDYEKKQDAVKVFEMIENE